MVNSLSLYPFYRDTWGGFDAAALQQLNPLAYDPCYVPKYYKAPDDPDEVLAAGAYLKFGLEISPGSLIWGAFHLPATGGFDVPGFVWKMTDLNLNIETMDQPMPDWFFCGANTSGPGFFPWLLNAPYPVVGKGLFDIEFWNNSGGALRCNMIFGVAEVNPCPGY